MSHLPLSSPAQRTPGPWRVDKFGVVVGPRGIAVADCNILHIRRGEEENRKNARLVAAAPDLLDALKAVVAIADRKTVEFDRARAAIAKAEEVDDGSHDA